MLFPSLLILLLTTFLSSATSAQSSSQSWYNLDEARGWQSCGTPQCAGGKNTANYNGPIVVGSPSLDGLSARFSFLKPNPSYSNALYWYNSVCCQTGISGSWTQFTYDVYFYIKTPNYVQALEFDINQTISDPATGTSVRYVFGHECNNKETGTWRIWDESYGWVNTGITCKLKPNSWTHLVFEQQRASDGRVYYSTIVVNGTTFALNYYGDPRHLSVLADDLNVAFQMDSDFKGDPYSVWLDKITLQAK